MYLQLPRFSVYIIFFMLSAQLFVLMFFLFNCDVIMCCGVFCALNKETNECDCLTVEQYVLL